MRLGIIRTVEFIEKLNPKLKQRLLPSNSNLKLSAGIRLYPPESGGGGRNRGLFGRHRVTISPEGVTDSGEHGQTSTAWRAVERVAAADEHVFIYTNALAAGIIPRRAFADASGFGEFVRTARGHHEKAVA